MRRYKKVVLAVAYGAKGNPGTDKLSNKEIEDTLREADESWGNFYREKSLLYPKKRLNIDMIIYTPIEKPAKCSSMDYQYDWVDLLTVIAVYVAILAGFMVYRSILT